MEPENIVQLVEGFPRMHKAQDSVPNAAMIKQVAGEYPCS